MYDKLFEKGRIGNVEIKNRLVMTPMGTNLAELDGTAGPAMLAAPRCLPILKQEPRAAADL